DAGLSWSIDSSTEPSCAIAAGVLSCGPVDLAPGASFTVHITSGTTSATAATSPVDNTANVTTTNDGSDSASDSIEVRGAAIDIAKTADDPSVSAGDPIGYVVTISNNGAGTAHGVSLDDTLPTNAGLSWSIDQANSSPGFSIVAGHLVYGPAELAAGASVHVHITSPTTAATCGEVDNTASFTTINAGSGSAPASIVVRCPDISVVKTANPAGPVSAGDPVGFDVTVTNHGAGTAYGVTVDDALPSNAGLSWSIDAQDGGWSIVSGHPSYGPTFLLAGPSSHVHVTSPTTAQDCTTILNTASGSSSNESSGNLGDDSSSASVTVLCASIAITKTADASPVSAGDPIGFTITVTKTADASSVSAGDPIGYVVTVTNNGSGIARNVTVDDTLPTNAGLSWSIDAGGSSSGFSIVGGHLTYGPADLAAGASVHVH